MSDVFISYSRKDIAFARLLQESLQQSQIDTWIDWERIPVGEKWWKEICEAIENANVFMFIISKNSIGSNVCKDEIYQALKNNKRIIPIIVDNLKPDAINKFAPELPQFNWIIFERNQLFLIQENPDIQTNRPEDSQVAFAKAPQFEEALLKLSKAIHTDWEWVKYHTRLQVSALLWESNLRNPGYLVRGSALEESEQQLLRATGKDPQPTSLQVEYVTASRKEETQQQHEQLKLEQKVRGRQRAAIWSVGIGLVMAVALGILAWGQRNQYLSETHVRATAESNAIDQRSTAEAASTLAIEQRNEAERQARIAISGQLAAQSQSQLAYHLDLAMLLAAESYKADDSYQSRSSLLLALEQSPQLARIYRYPENITALAFSPDGEQLAAAGCTQRDAKQDACLKNEIVFYDLDTAQTVQVLAAGPGRPTGLAFTPDRSALYAAFAGDRTYRFDLSAAGQPASIPLPAFANSSDMVVISPDGKYMATGGCHMFSMPGGLCDQGGIILWDLSSVNPPGLVLKGVGTQMHNLAFSSQSDRLFAGDCSGLQANSCQKGEVKTWDLPDGNMQEHPVEGTTSAIISVDLSADGKLLAAGEAAGIIHIIDLSDWKQVTSHSQKSSVDSLLFSRSGGQQILASLSFGTPIEVISATNSRDTFTLEPYQTTRFMDALAISPDGRFLASSSCALPGQYMDCQQSQIYLWNLFSWQPVAQVFSGSDPSQWSSWQIGFDPSTPQKPIVIAASSQKIVVWDVEKNQPAGQPFMTASDIDISDIFLNHSGKVLAYTELIGKVQSTRVHFSDVTSRQVIGAPVMIDGWVLDAIFSPDDHWMVSDGPDGTFLVWDPSTAQVVHQISVTLNPDYIKLAFSPDGKTLAAAGCILSKGNQPCQTYRIEMFNLETGKILGKPFEGSMNGVVNLLEFSPDGKKIGINTSAPNPRDEWWDLKSRQTDSLLNNLAVEWLRSPDGLYSLNVDCEIGNNSSCGVGLITLSDVQKREPIGQPIRNPDSSVKALGFSPDSRFLYTSEISRMTVWSIDPQDWVSRICQISNRNFTQAEWELYMPAGEAYHKTCPDLP